MLAYRKDSVQYGPFYYCVLLQIVLNSRNKTDIAKSIDDRFNLDCKPNEIEDYLKTLSKLSDGEFRECWNQLLKYKISTNFSDIVYNYSILPYKLECFRRVIATDNSVPDDKMFEILQLFRDFFMTRSNYACNWNQNITGLMIKSFGFFLKEHHSDVYGIINSTTNKVEFNGSMLLMENLEIIQEKKYIDSDQNISKLLEIIYECNTNILGNNGVKAPELNPYNLLLEVKAGEEMAKLTKLANNMFLSPQPNDKILIDGNLLARFRVPIYYPDYRETETSKNTKKLLLDMTEEILKYSKSPIAYSTLINLGESLITMDTKRSGHNTSRIFNSSKREVNLEMSILFANGILAANKLFNIAKNDDCLNPYSLPDSIFKADAVKGKINNLKNFIKSVESTNESDNVDSLSAICNYTSAPLINEIKGRIFNTGSKTLDPNNIYENLVKLRQNLGGVLNRIFLVLKEYDGSFGTSLPYIRLQILANSKARIPIINGITQYLLGNDKPDKGIFSEFVGDLKTVGVSVIPKNNTSELPEDVRMGGLVLSFLILIDAYFSMICHCTYLYEKTIPRDTLRDHIIIPEVLRSYDTGLIYPLPHECTSSNIHKYGLVFDPVPLDDSLPLDDPLRLIVNTDPSGLSTSIYDFKLVKSNLELLFGDLGNDSDSTALTVTGSVTVVDPEERARQEEILLKKYEKELNNMRVNIVNSLYKISNDRRFSGTLVYDNMNKILYLNKLCSDSLDKYRSDFEILGIVGSSSALNSNLTKLNNVLAGKPKIDNKLWNQELSKRNRSQVNGFIYDYGEPFLFLNKFYVHKSGYLVDSKGRFEPSSRYL